MSSNLQNEINRLNDMLRRTGYGQGQIDAYAAVCEERDRLHAVAVKILLWHLHHPDANPELLDELRDAAGLTNEELLEMDK